MVYCLELSIRVERIIINDILLDTLLFSFPRKHFNTEVIHMNCFKRLLAVVLGYVKDGLEVGVGQGQVEGAGVEGEVSELSRGWAVLVGRVPPEDHVRRGVSGD